MAASTFAELQDRAQEMIRKGLEGSIFVLRYSDSTWATDKIETLVDTDGKLEIPEGYDDVGFITKDQGAQWTRDIETSDVMSLGATEPTRRDTVSDVAGLQFTMQESKATVIDLYEGINLSDVEQDANGNVSYDRPDRPASTYWRVLALFKDGEGTDAIYFARFMPRVQITDRGEQSWNEEDEVQYPVTMTAFVDSDAGTSVRNLWAGPAAFMTKMGFETSGT